LQQWRVDEILTRPFNCAVGSAGISQRRKVSSWSSSIMVRELGNVLIRIMESVCAAYDLAEIKDHEGVGDWVAEGSSTFGKVDAGSERKRCQDECLDFGSFR
jgi:hypothetical protein